VVFGPSARSSPPPRLGCADEGKEPPQPRSTGGDQVGRAADFIDSICQ
jgi:hypothetical protein